MDVEKKKAFNPEDTGELDIPPHMQQKAREELNRQQAGGVFDPESTTDFPDEADPLAEERRLDLERLAPIVADKSDSFHDKSLPYDTAQADDPQATLRQIKYENEKAKYDQSPADFYEDTGLNKNLEAEAQLSESQRALLETVTKLSDATGFEESNEAFRRMESLRPSVAAPGDFEPVVKKPEVEEPMQPTALELADIAEGKSVQANLTYEKMQLLTGQADASGEKPPHEIGVVDRDELLRRSPPMSTELKIGIGLVALAIPLFTWSMYSQSHGYAEADRMQREQSMAMASETAEKQSVANKMSEPYRMPAGQTGPLGGGSTNAALQTGSKSEGDSLANWHPPANPSPAPTAAELAQNQQSIKQAEQAMALGNKQQAFFILNAALSRSPGDVQMCLAVARAYMNSGDYATAKRILQGAMKGARTIGDFSLLQQLLASCPG